MFDLKKGRARWGRKEDREMGEKRKERRKKEQKEGREEGKKEYAGVRERKKNAGRNGRRHEKSFGFPTNPTIKQG